MLIRWKSGHISRKGKWWRSGTGWREDANRMPSAAASCEVWTKSHFPIHFCVSKTRTRAFLLEAKQCRCHIEAHVPHFIAFCLLLLGDGDTLKQYYTPGWCFTGAQGESVGVQTHIFTTFGILRISLAVEVCDSHTSSCFLCRLGRHRRSLSKFHLSHEAIGHWHIAWLVETLLWSCCSPFSPLTSRCFLFSLSVFIVQ